LTVHATEALRLTGGVRYTEDRKNFTSASTTLAVVCSVPAPTGCPAAPLIPYTTTLAAQAFVPATNGGTVVRAPGVLIRRTDVPASGSLRTSKVTYRGAVEFDVGERSMLYASVETGYRAGGFNPTFNYGPESITAYTIGSKNRFFDNRVQFNVELFQWKYRGQQLTYLGLDPLGRIGVLTQNVGRSTIKGVEVDARVLVTPTTTLSGNVQYLDATYDSFTYATPARPFSGCAVTQTTTFTVDCSGRPAINSPKWTVNLGAEQVVPMGDYQLTISADTQYRSGRFVGFEYIAPEYVDHSWASNAQISMGTADGKYVLSAFVRNIENSRINTYATPVPASNLIVQIPTAPRTYGLRLSARF
jgi:iron complex outermembrane receptor protein